LKTPEEEAAEITTEPVPQAITESVPQITITKAAPKITIQETKTITKTVPKRITLSGAFRWVFGVAYLLVGLMYLIQGKVFSSGFAFLIVILLIPLNANSQEGKYNYSLSGPLRFVIVLILAMFVGLFSIVES